MSLDDVATQRAFHEAQELDFALLSDVDGSAARKLGALAEGRPFARRVTFVIDREGVIRKIDAEVDVTRHGADLAAWIRAADRRPEERPPTPTPEKGRVPR